VCLVQTCPGVHGLDNGPGRHDDCATAFALVTRELLEGSTSGATPFRNTRATICDKCSIPKDRLPELPALRPRGPPHSRPSGLVRTFRRGLSGARDRVS